jgi:hypothetical protein
MRDIVQVSATIYSSSTGIISVGSKIQPINPVDMEGFLDAFSKLSEYSVMWDESELWDLIE